jgi:putative transposase
VVPGRNSFGRECAGLKAAATRVLPYNDRVIFHHKNIRLDPNTYLGPKTYFVTLCCESRQPEFQSVERGRWLLDCLRQPVEKQQMALHAYCIMPDHVHVLLEGKKPSSNLLVFLKNFKQTTAYQFKQETGRPLWQKKFYDHILRADEKAEAVAWYIWLNPVRKGLCVRPEDYPLSGSFTMPWPQNHLPVELWVPYWKKRV